jgi:hypothetical protein
MFFDLNPGLDLHLCLYLYPGVYFASGVGSGSQTRRVPVH